MDVSLNRDRPYFEGSVPVRLATTTGTASRSLLPQRPGEAFKLVDLTVRLLPGTDAKGASVRQRIVHLELSDDRDPFFLHQMTVSEAEFADIASEQSILVDFAAFPAKLVELLQACVDHRDDAQPKFFASLAVSDPAPGGAAHLSLLETTAFRQVAHLRLGTRVGSDAAIKRYLAGRLQGALAALAVTREELHAARDEAAASSAAGAATREELARARLAAEGAGSAAAVAHAGAMLAARQEADDRLRATEARSAADAAAAVSRFEAAAAAQQARLDEARAEAAEAQAARAGLEAALREARQALGAASAEAQTATAALQRLREATAGSDGERLAAQRELTAAQLRVAVLETSLREKEEAARRAAEQLASADAGRGAQEDALGLYRATVAKQQGKLEACVAEINKGNAVIARLQDECRAAKAAARAAKDAGRASERAADESCAAAAAAQREASSARGEAQRERDAREAAEASLGALRGQLGEARDALAHNQQVIAWLNRELTEAQAAGAPSPLGHGLSAGPGSAGSGGRAVGSARAQQRGGGSFASPVPPAAGAAAAAAPSGPNTAFSTPIPTAGHRPQQQQLWYTAASDAPAAVMPAHPPPSQIPRLHAANASAASAHPASASPPSPPAAPALSPSPLLEGSGNGSALLLHTEEASTRSQRSATTHHLLHLSSGSGGGVASVTSVTQQKQLHPGGGSAPVGGSPDTSYPLSSIGGRGVLLAKEANPYLQKLGGHHPSFGASASPLPQQQQQQQQRATPVAALLSA